MIKVLPSTYFVYLVTFLVTLLTVRMYILGLVFVVSIEKFYQMLFYLIKKIVSQTLFNLSLFFILSRRSGNRLMCILILIE